jgi:hypothetical protein
MHFPVSFNYMPQLKDKEKKATRPEGHHTVVQILMGGYKTTRGIQR